MTSKWRHFFGPKVVSGFSSYVFVTLGVQFFPIILASLLFIRIKSFHFGIKLTKVHLMPTLSAAWKANVKFLFWENKRVKVTHTQSETTSNTAALQGLYLPFPGWWAPGRGCVQAGRCGAQRRRPGRRSSCCWSLWYQYSEKQKWRSSNSTLIQD